MLGLWWASEKSLSVPDIKTRRGELFYWTAILFSNTLGTALGDYLADDSGLGFGGSALLIASLLAVVVLAYYFTSISQVLLFWVAFVFTRPFGATFGDLLTKSPAKHGLEFGTTGSSLILFGMLVGLVIYASVKKYPIPLPHNSNQEVAVGQLQRTVGKSPPTRLWCVPSSPSLAVASASPACLRTPTLILRS